MQEPDKKKETPKPNKQKEEETIPFTSEDIPSEDIEMIREKNNPFASRTYDDDNSYSDDR